MSGPMPKSSRATSLPVRLSSTTSDGASGWATKRCVQSTPCDVET